MAVIKDIRLSNLGSIEFDLSCKGHRGFQTFILYPIENTDYVTIQSDKRIGYYYFKTGKIQLSRSRQRGSYFIHLSFDELVEFVLTTEQKIKLNEQIRTKSNNGTIVKCNNDLAKEI